MFDFDLDWAKNFVSGFFEKASDVLYMVTKAKIAIWVGRILSALGLAFVAQKFLYDPLISQVQDAWSAIPASIANWVHALGIDTGVSIILSAYGIKGAERMFIQRRNDSA